MFFILAVFLFSFFFINYKWGLVATPVLQYGMFAGVFHLKDTQTVYTVTANNKAISNATISYTQRDIIQIYIERYQNYKAINESAYTTMKKYVKYTGLSAFMQFNKYTPVISDTVFTNWYKAKIEAITGEPIKTLEVHEQHFVWQNGALAAIDTPIKLTFIAP